MIKNEEYINYLKKIISCVNNGDYYSIKELSILNLNKLKEETSLMEKELDKYMETNIHKRELRDIKEQELLYVVNLYMEYIFDEIKENKELKKIASIEEFIQKSNQMINLALEISDRIVRLMGYNLDSINHIEQSRIKVPDSRLAETMKHCVCLDYSFVEDLMPDESLRQNLFVEFENKELAQVVNGQQQEFFPHPFLQANNGEIILLNPSILASFTIHQLVLLADSYGIKQQLIDAYNNEIWRKCRQDLRNLGHKKIKESEYGITLMNNQHRKEEILAVGSNKLLFVQFICDSGDSYDSHSMFSQQIMEPDTPPNRARAEYFIKNLPFADWENIYQIVILNSCFIASCSNISKKSE